MTSSDPVGIFIGGFKINSMDNSSSLSVGDVFFQALASQSKNNMANGQTFGDCNFNNFQPIASPIYDPDGIDTMMPIAMSPLGLED